MHAAEKSQRSLCMVKVLLFFQFCRYIGNVLQQLSREIVFQIKNSLTNFPTTGIFFNHESELLLKIKNFFLDFLPLSLQPVVKTVRYQQATLQTVLRISFCKRKCLPPLTSIKGRYSLFDRRNCKCSLSSY